MNFFFEITQSIYGPQVRLALSHYNKEGSQIVFNFTQYDDVPYNLDCNTGSINQIGDVP